MVLTFLYGFFMIASMALMSRWRGGGWPFILGEVNGGQNDHKRTQVRRIAFAATAGLFAWNPFVAIVLFASTLTGWGFPVSAAIGARGKKDFEGEFMPFDFLAKWIIAIFGYSYRARAYGIIWLTLHGMLFGSICALWTLEPAYILMASMGLCYSFAKDWESGELLFGSVIGLAIFLSTYN